MANGALSEPTKTRNKPSQQTKDYISNGMKLIHSPEMQDTILSRLEGDQDVKALSDLSLQIVNRLDASMGQSGVQVGYDTKMKGLSVFMTQLIEVGAAAGLVDVGEKEIQAASGDAVGRYMKEGLAKGTITEDEMREAYKVIQQNNPDQTVMFDKEGTPGVNKTATKIPSTSPKPSALGGI